MKQEQYGYVYKITNKIDGKIYVGIRSSSSLDTSYWGSGIHITNAIHKHGVDNFHREILEWCSSREELNEREKYWIATLESRNPDIGYNITAGGDGGNTYQYLTKEQMDSIRPKLSIYSQDEATVQLWKKHLHEANVGANNPMYGKHHSDSARQKMSAAKKGTYVPWNKGKNMSEESKRRLSESQRKRHAARKHSSSQ